MTVELAYFLIYAIVFLFGSSIGSFINVIVYRLPRGLSPVAGRSFCPSCSHALSPLDMLPVLGWALLGGRCRYCHERVSPRYPLVEAAVGLLAVAFAVKFWLGWAMLVAFLLAAAVVAVALIDLDTMTIPDSLIVTIGLLSLASLAVEGGPSVPSRVFGALWVSLLMWLITAFVPGAFGGGDVKLTAVCGFYLGGGNMAVAFFVALLLGGSYAIFLLATGRAKKGAHMPFGPFLGAGIVFAMFFGNAICSWYAAFLF